MHTELLKELSVITEEEQKILGGRAGPTRRTADFTRRQARRLSQAAYLLLGSSLPVSDIIQSAGYDNTSYFYTKFKERYGISPGEYRKKPCS